MPAKKGAAKAAPVKTAAPKDKAIAVVEETNDWPAGLSEDTADALFERVESGETIKQAAEAMGMKGNTVYQWRRRYPRFAERLNEAEEIGFDMAIDGYRDITATDRDSAAGAQVAITVLDKFLSRKRPERFHTNPFKPAAGNGEMLLGVVVVPAKQITHETVIDAEFAQVDVPAKVPT